MHEQVEGHIAPSSCLSTYRVLFCGLVVCREPSVFVFVGRSSIHEHKRYTSTVFESYFNDYLSCRRIWDTSTRQCLKSLIDRDNPTVYVPTLFGRRVVVCIGRIAFWKPSALFYRCARNEVTRGELADSSLYRIRIYQEIGF